ncbi:MAG TPA: RecX family transcriptional regulator, partial [Anaerolineales bacterium]|nr:RecX family transcriptional regulator [Anaerolineales bacterium]
MDTITDIKPQRRDKNRVNVFLDGKFAFSLAYNQAKVLTVGQGLSQVVMANLLENDSVDKAYEKAVRFIGYRPRSILEVRNRLIKYGIEFEVIEKVINRLQEENVLNDTDFALLWVENRRTFRPRGKLLLRKELLTKGINDSDIEIALSEVEESADARQLVYSKL